MNHIAERDHLNDLASPDWLLAGFDDERGRFQFAQVSRQTYRDSSFLDHRIKPMPERLLSATGAEVDSILSQQSGAPAAYVFHTAFCASTLLAFCLDHPSRTLVLREPKVLVQLGGLYRDAASVDSEHMSRLGQRVLGLLNRSYAGEAAVVKPSNFANSLLQGVLSQRTAAGEQHRCLMLGSGLRSLIISILKKAPEARERMPGFLAALLRDSDYRTQVDLPPLDALDLLQQSAVFWHCQRHFFQGISNAYPPRRVLPVSMETFLLRPLETLHTINDFLQLGLSEEILSDVVEQGAFRQHSKTRVGYSPEQQRAEADAVARGHEVEIRRTLEWAKPLLRAFPVKPFSDDEEEFA